MRRGLRILVLAMVMAGLVAGAASAVTFINIATGSTGGAYYPLGAAMAKIWNDNIEGIKASAQSTGGTVNNIQLMGSGEAETGFM
ncbi:MAG TPA: TAXI family TRAP transporter solute-binding subunit, partial [Synergistales bacterium]|nr:TAXI family TRAP transporter solute-binding subunit [Synergistales bacterium]